LSLFSQLLDEVADANRYPLDNCLLRAKLLASRLPGRSFRQWVDAELDGYPHTDAVPDYRRIRTQIVGHFSGMFGSQMRNVRLSVTNWGDDVRERLESFYFIDNVGALQALLDAETDTFHNRLDIDFVTLYRASGDVRVDGMILQDAMRIFTKAALHGVLHAIRKRLLDFLIDLRERHPELEQTDAAIANVPEEELSQIVDRRIYNGCQFINAAGGITTGGNLTVADKIERSFGEARGG
jgi:hypothetical protein